MNQQRRMRYLILVQQLLLLLLLAVLFHVDALSSSGSSTTAKRKVAVIGTTGNLGRTVISQLSSQQIPVKCLLRHPMSSLQPNVDSITNDSTSLEVASYLSSLEGVEMVEGDVTDAESLVRLLEGCTEVIAVHGTPKPKNYWPSIFPFLSNEDTDPTHSKQINYVGIRNILQAASSINSIRRIVRITGNNEKPFSFFAILLNMLGKMSKGWNYEGEQLLRTSNVPYTIIRPGLMRHDNYPGNVKALGDNGTSDLKVSAVSYNQIAELCIDCIHYDNTARSTLVAMNVPEGQGESSYAPLLQTVQPDHRHYPPTLIDKHKQGARLGATVLLTVVALGLKTTLSIITQLINYLIIS